MPSSFWALSVSVQPEIAELAATSLRGAVAGVGAPEGAVLAAAMVVSPAF